LRARSERTGAAVFVDRLYPRGIPKARMAGVLWLKDITPSAALREWYHADVQAHFDEFTQRFGKNCTAKPSRRP
jgi:uncharacterized protein YeaO (DUF488 family)